MCPSGRGFSTSHDELKSTMAGRSEAELRAILEAPPGEYTADAIEASREELSSRGLSSAIAHVSLVHEAVAPDVRKKTRVLGKWDLVVCAALSVLGLASNRSAALWTNGAKSIPFLIGQFVGILVIWTLLKGGFLFVKGLIKSFSKG